MRLEGKLIEKRAMGGKMVIFRYITLSDSRGLSNLVNSLVKEKANIGTTKHVTEKKQRKILKTFLKTMGEEGITIVADSGVYAGSCTLRRGKKIFSQTADLGVFLLKKYRKMGIGKRLMELAMGEAKRIWNVRIVKLEVFKNNGNAIKTYKRLGFKKYGEIQREALHWGKYKDVVYMHKRL
ncbi:MAG: GNAT family N-acetyltransferase [Candidatus Aenigmarchaeota archaeon]|nr:GNAT family N-acetyltransferase [Candidatus Aenigmarchaeota archaeon]